MGCLIELVKIFIIPIIAFIALIFFVKTGQAVRTHCHPDWYEAYCWWVALIIARLVVSFWPTNEDENPFTGF